METITLDQLRAAFILWETDVRANRDGFASDDEARTAPLDQAADGYIKVITQYIAKSQEL
jgi:hypothetical protein